MLGRRLKTFAEGKTQVKTLAYFRELLELERSTIDETWSEEERDRRLIEQVFAEILKATDCIDCVHGDEVYSKKKLRQNLATVLGKK